MVGWLPLRSSSSPPLAKEKERRKGKEGGKKRKGERGKKEGEKGYILLSWPWWGRGEASEPLYYIVESIKFVEILFAVVKTLDL